MASGDDIFAWSGDLVAGRPRNDAAFASAIATVEMVLAAIIGGDA